MAIVLFLVATTAVWAKRTVLSRDRVVTAVDSALADPAVIDALSLRVTDELVKLVDVQALVQDVLPPALDKLGPIIEAQLRPLVQEQVAKVMASDTGRELIDAAVRKAHDAAMRLLQGEGLAPDSAFAVVDGEVRLDIVPLIVNTVELMQTKGIISDRFDLTDLAKDITSDQKVQLLARVFGVTVPENFGQITILDSTTVARASATLDSAQRSLAIFQKATALLVILALGLIALSLFLSVERRRTLAQLAIGIGVGALLMRIGIDRVVAAINRAIDKAGARAAAVNITESLTESLARTLVTIAIVGLSVGLIAHMAKANEDGSPSWLTATVSQHPDIARIAIIGVSLALLAVVGLAWITVIVVGALCVAGVLYVNRHTVAAAD
jgi:hypothetical protein